MKPKKNLAKRCGLFVCAFLLILSMTACGSRDDEKEQEEVQTEEVTPKAEEEKTDEEETEEPEDAGSYELTEEGKFASIQGMLDSDLMSEQLESQMASLEDSGMSCELSADGEALVYNFTIEDADMAAAMTKDVLDSQMESLSSTFESIASVLPSMVDGLENPSIIVRYLNPDGEEITSMEYFASEAE